MAKVKSVSLQDNLEKLFCYKCGACMRNADMNVISSAPTVFIAHAACPTCRTENVVTFSGNNSGTMALVTDLKVEELKKFSETGPVTHDDLLELHVLLKKNSLWKLLHKKEKNLENK